jgi:cytochrome c
MRFSAVFPILFCLVTSAVAEMRGHGGPVRAIAVSADGKTAATGSFDTSVIVWDLESETAKQVMRIHEGPVNTVSFDGQDIVSVSDGKTVVWTLGQAASKSTRATLPPKDNAIASASMRDGVVLSYPDGRLVLAGRSLVLPATANMMAVVGGESIIAGGADGHLYILHADGSIRLDVAVQEMPITSLAVSVDGRMIAAAGLRGAVTIIEFETGKVVSTLVGPGLPVWSVAFHPDGKTILTGGADRVVRKWNVASGQPLAPANAPKPDFPASVMNERGAQVFRACEACHTVTPDGGNRAGPTLHGVFGRRIGTARDYLYSPRFAEYPIVWNTESISRLFREGPMVVTPGTKMPDQTISDGDDLKALVNWLERVTQ